MRNLLHYIAGFLIMFLVAYLCKFHTYTHSAKTIGIPLLSIILGFILGFWWELYQIASKQTIKIGWDDVLRTTIGSAIGGFLGTFLIY